MFSIELFTFNFKRPNDTKIIHFFVTFIREIGPLVLLAKMNDIINGNCYSETNFDVRYV